jgi:hypothetical protein
VNRAKLEGINLGLILRSAYRVMQESSQQKQIESHRAPTFALRANTPPVEWPLA